jgi:uncharacterized protein (TIGR03086 family)
MPRSDDPRTMLRRALDQSAAVIARLQPEQMTLPTPCSEFDARALAGHMLFAAERIAKIGRREDLSLGDPVVTGLADGEWAPAFDKAAQEALSAWSGPDALAGEIALPFGTFPAPVVAGIYTLEHVTHAWDLAAVLAITQSLAPELAEAVLPLALELVPAEVRGGEMPFAAVVEVPADAPVYDRLVGYLGRDPGFAPRGAR